MFEIITTEGKNHIKRYLAGWAPAIAQTVAFGIGARAENLGDYALELETTRTGIVLTTYDFANNKLIYKAPIPDDYVGKVYEVGIFSLPNNPIAGEYGSRLVTTFDSSSEDWINPATGLDATFANTATRVGIDSLVHGPGTSTSLTSSLRNIALDFSGNSAADGFTFAYNVGTANTSQIVFRFMTDASNYYSYSMGTQTSGYKFIEKTKAEATVTGTPSWANITEIQIITTSGAGGASSVEYDAIRIEDRDATNLDYVLVARKVLAVPFTKTDGMAQDLEFSLDVSL